MIKASSLIFLFSCCCLTSYAQLTFHIDHYTSQNGLPQNSVLTMEFDSVGYLWLSTEAGIAKFDGTSMKVFNTISNPEFVADRGMKILKMNSGELVILNAKTGPFLFKSGKMVEVKDPYILGHNFYGIKGAIPSIDIHEQFVKENLIEKYFNDYKGPNVQIFPLSDTGFLMIGSEKVFLFHNTALQQTFPLSAYQPVGYFMMKGKLLFLDRQNQLHSMNPNNGVVTNCLLSGDSWNSLPGTKIHYESSWPFENSFVISGNMLYKISATADSNHFQSTLITKELPSGCVINCMSYDAARRIFAIGTDSKGLFLFRESSLKTMRTKETEENTNNVFYAQLPMDSSHVLTNNQRIFDSNSPAISKSDIGPYTGYALMRDKEGGIWYSNSDKIFRYHPSLKSAIQIRKKFLADISHFYEYNDKVWVASQSGIGFIKDDSVTQLLTYDGIQTFCFLQVPGRGLLTGHEKGAYFLDPQTFKKDTIDALDGICVRSIESVDDIIFIGTYGNGFYLWKNGRLVKAPLDRNDNMKDVHTFFEDNKGFIWMTTNKGLFKTTLASLQHFFIDTTASVYYYRYGVDDGIVSDEFNGGCNPAYARLDNGYVSLPTMQGLVWLKPEEVPAILPGESISIENITIDQIHVPLSSTLHLNCNYRLVEIDFSTPYFGSQENLWMDYKIEGFHEKWIQINNSDLDLQIPKIGHGNFLLVIRKKSGFGTDDWVYFRLPVVVAPCIYQTTWFISLCIAFLLFSFWVALHIGANNIRRRNKKFEYLVGQRTEELKNANQQLEVSVNVKEKLISILSHDIVTPLRFIGLSAKLAQKQNHDNADVLSHTLGDIQNATEKLYDNASNMLNWINLQNHRIAAKPSNVAVFSLVDELFDNWMELAKRKENELINDVSEDHILCTDPQLLGIVLSNIISNAIKHTKKGFIKISAREVTSAYEFEITDNGSGISSDLLKRINSPAEDQLLITTAAENDFGGSGLGYLLIRDLLGILDGSHEVMSEWGIGTTVIIRLKPMSMHVT